VPVSGSRTLATVTSSVEVPAWTLRVAPMGAPRRRGRRWRARGALVDTAVVDAGPAVDAVALLGGAPWPEPPHPAAQTAVPRISETGNRKPWEMRSALATEAQDTQGNGHRREGRRPDGRSCPTGTRNLLARTSPLGGARIRGPRMWETHIAVYPFCEKRRKVDDSFPWALGRRGTAST
jgi:hypothetical protein